MTQVDAEKESMIVTVASATDIPGLHSLVNGAYRGTAAARGWTHEAGLLDGQRTDAESLRAAMDGGATILIMSQTEGDLPLACISVEPKADGGTWYLGMLTVSPERQDAGLGRAMLEAGEAHACAAGGRRIELTVIQVRDTLIAWYERRGYRRTGETAPFPYDDLRFGEPLRPDLHFVVLEKSLDQA